MKKKLKLPKFKNEDAEREYWAKINLAEYYEAKDLEVIIFSSLNKERSNPYTPEEWDKIEKSASINGKACKSSQKAKEHISSL